MPESHTSPLDRRRFFRGTAAAAASVALPASSYAKVAGSNDRLGVAFLGCGARAQAHMNLILKFARDRAGVAPVAVCDVWEGINEEYDHVFAGKVTRRRHCQGLYPSALKCGLDPSDRSRVAKDYRRVLACKDVDLVCISTPDHWHARMTLDAIAAGKDVYVEKPMTRTPAEAIAVSDAAQRQNRVVTVGVQGLTDPSCRTALQWIQEGKIGHVGLIHAGAFRNDSRGQWRFYRITSAMNPSTIDWDLFLGHRFEVNGVRLAPTPAAFPFRPELFAQWRCYSPFSSGPISDLLTHPMTKMLAATGLRFPKRVAGMGGLFLEKDGRDVPDVSTVTADYSEGCQLQLTATTISSYPTEEVIRGRQGTIRFIKGGLQFFEDDPAKTGRFPTRMEHPLEPTELLALEAPRNETEALWENFLDCVRRRDRATICPPELGAASVVTLAMGWDASRMGMMLAWDRERREVRPV